jgi:DNA-binding transcriptional LysR family regulator
MTGVGISILPASAAKNELESGSIIGLSLPDFLANSSLCAITRQEDTEDPSPLVRLGTRIFTSGWMEKS